MRAMVAEKTRAEDPETDDGSGAADIGRLAARTLAALSRAGVPATPQAYAVAYARLAAGRGDDLPPALVEKLRAQATDPAEALDALTLRMDDTVRDLRHDVDAAGAGTSAYGRTLEHLAASLGADPARGDAEAVAVVIEETRRMWALNQQLDQRLSGAAAEIERLRADLDAVRREARTDPLTGLPNRKAFDQALAEGMAAAAEGAPLGVLILDVDHFKRFNDTHGHEAGDHVLKLVARTVADVVAEHGGEACTMARIGGEEFAAVLPGHGCDAARALAERVRAAMDGRFLRHRRTGEDMGRITLSVGVALARADDEAADLLARADAALYLAKRQGRNAVRCERQLAAAEGI